MNTRLEADYLTYAKLRNHVKTYCKRAVEEYESKIAAESKTNPKAFYAYVRSKLKTKEKIADLKTADGRTASDDHSKAQVLNKFFSSVFVEDNQSNPSFPIRDFKNSCTTTEITVDKIKGKLKELKTNKSPGPDLHHPLFLKAASDALATPIAAICEKSMTTGLLPEAWKVAHVSPIYKKGPKEIPSNYRPVSLTSLTCKIMEKLVRDTIVNHLTENNFFSDHQHGFMQGRSCSSNLLSVLDKWTNAIDQGLPVDVVYLDLAKAFDKVSHPKLILKLKAYGIDGNLLNWIKEFLSNRKQRVVINGKESSWEPVTSGVPQGSVLGPVLFVIYVNDLPEVTQAVAEMFADDTKLFRLVPDDESRKSLQDDINRLTKWAEDWQLQFNADKCKILHIGHNNIKSEYHMTNGTDTTTLEITTLEKDLGVHVDPQLKFSRHVEKQVNKANQILGMIRRTFEHLDAYVMKKLFTALVRPHLEFCNVVWSPLLQKDINLIEGVQRRASRMVPELKGLEYEDRLKRMKLPSLQYRRARGDMIEVYKHLKNHYTTNQDLLVLHGTSITRGHNYKLRKSHARTSIRKHFFSNRVVDHWNSLPAKTVNAPSLNSFKNRIDNYWKDYTYTLTKPRTSRHTGTNEPEEMINTSHEVQDQLTGPEA